MFEIRKITPKGAILYVKEFVLFDYYRIMKKLDFRKFIEIFISCAGLAICSLGLIINVNGIFFTPIANALNVGRGAISLTSTLTTLTIGFTSVVAMKLIQKGSFKKILLLSIIVTIVSTLCMSFVHSLWMFYVLSIIRGISSAFIGTPIVTMIIGKWFITKRGLISGLVMSFSGVGGAVMNPILNKVIQNYGYQKALIVVAILMAIVSLPSLFFLNESPEKEGYVPYLEENEKDKKRNSFSIEYKKISWMFLTLVMIAFICQSICSLAQHLSGYAETIGYASEVGALLISSAMVGNIGGKFIVGLLSDMIGEINAGISLIFLFIVGMTLLYVFNTNMICLYVGALLLGMSYASAVMLSNIVFALYGNKQYGDAYALLTIVINTGGALAVALIGYGYDYFKSYDLIFMTGIIIGIIALSLLLLISKEVKKHAL